MLASGGSAWPHQADPPDSGPQSLAVLAVARQEMAALLAEALRDSELLALVVPTLACCWGVPQVPPVRPFQVDGVVAPEEAQWAGREEAVAEREGVQQAVPVNLGCLSLLPDPAAQVLRPAFPQDAEFSNARYPKSHDEPTYWRPGSKPHL